MPAFDTEQWRVLSPYLDQALDISPENRAAWLESLREQNPSLATDLQTLLNEHDALGGEGFLKTGEAARPTHNAPIAARFCNIWIRGYRKTKTPPYVPA